MYTLSLKDDVPMEKVTPENVMLIPNGLPAENGLPVENGLPAENGTHGEKMVGKSLSKEIAT